MPNRKFVRENFFDRQFYNFFFLNYRFFMFFSFLIGHISSISCNVYHSSISFWHKKVAALMIADNATLWLMMMTIMIREGGSFKMSTITDNIWLLGEQLLLFNEDKFTILLHLCGCRHQNRHHRSLILFFHFNTLSS